MDYCNAVLHGSRVTTQSKLQRVQNNIARVVLRVPRYTHALPLLHQLHWLPIGLRITYKLAVLTFRSPIGLRITYKLAVLTFRSHQHSSPKYLNELFETRSCTRTLRSANRQLLEISRTRTVFASRSFRVAAPTIWNSLPTDAFSCSAVDTFKNT
jgi:hypothetical protein